MAAFADATHMTPNRNVDFLIISTSINLKNKGAGDGCRDKTIEKAISRTLRARTSKSYRPNLVTAGIGKAAYRGGA
jgi:hypothetical protein